ncbi:ABC transporter substrate-binding protein [Geobacter sp. AOG1]|uniref:ABC transporter substrate-binding protein n=1 Tax=Geobacter sp. AOG1 TaxID=1566346 RepID=UPI001CC69D55|nr:ABC transporter substrate-binding protein [Geobacter sp. AOG1]GFE59388.1 ABC transporter substrate-binding protein [Geobacter sp. AOG1]
MKSPLKGTVCLVILGAAMLLAACQKEPVRLGFVGGITGRSADLGVAGRNGAMLAVEQKNAAGGINGHLVELLIRDDGQSPDAARRVVAELIGRDVEIIIGPMTSSIAMATVPLVNSSKTVMLSPTVTTTDLAGKDDNFLRVIATTRDYASKSARYQAEKLGHRTVAAIYDLDNRSYTESWINDFRTTLESLGGRMAAVKSFRSGDDTVFSEEAKGLLSSRPDVVLVVCNAVDAAMICQQVRKLKPSQPIVMAEWASTQRLIELAGAAVESVHVAQYLDHNDHSERYQNFRRAYQERFGQEPGYAGIAGYDSATVALAALARRKAGTSIKEAILAIRTFQGVQQTITIDRFGDADRRTFITTIRNGQYVTKE